MSIIIRLQNLPWSANSVDIRRYFQGLSIPEGGVHIVGGEKGDAFIAFSTDEDARQAMEKDGGKIKEIRIKLFLSSRTEMQRVIEQARSQNLALQAAVPAQPAIPVQKPVVKETERRRPTDRSRSPERRRDRDKSPIDRDRSSRRSSRRERSRSRSPRRARDRERERHNDRSKRDERRRSEEISKSARDEDVRSLPTAEQLGMSRDRDIDKRQILPNGDVGTPLPDMRAISAYLPSEGSGMPSVATFTTTSYPANYSISSNYPSSHMDRARLERVPPASKEFDSLKQSDTHWNTSFPHAETKKDAWEENRRGLLGPPPGAYEHEKPFIADKRNYPSEPPISRGRYSGADIADSKFPPYSGQSHIEERGRQENIDSLLPRPSLSSHREDFDGYREQRGRLEEPASSRYDDARVPPDERSLPGVNRDHPHHSSQLMDSGFDPYARSLGSCVEIRGMPYNVNYKDVREFFRGLYLPSDGLKLINDESGHRTGVGFVRFANEHDAAEALKRSGQYMGNSFIEVMKCPDDIFENAVDSYIPATTRKPGTSNALINRLPPKEEDLCILLKGLPYQCKEEAIINFFDGLSILDVFIEYDRSGRAIGTGFVEFGSYEDFQAAMNMNRRTIGHRYIELSVASKEMMNEARKNAGNNMRSSLSSGDSSAKELLPLNSPPNDGSSPSCVLMQGLPYDVTDRDIADFFAEVGVVPRAIHIMLGPNGMPYGDAFAEFSSVQEFERAIKKNGQFMGPVMVTVKSIPYPDMIEILGGPREGPLLDRPTSETRERSEIDMVSRRMGPPIQERRMGPPDRRMDHLLPERRMEHPPPGERRMGPSQGDRRMGRAPHPSSQSQDRRGGQSDRRMEHSERKGGSDRRMERRGPPSNRRSDSAHSDKNEKSDSSENKISENAASESKSEDTKRSSDKSDHKDSNPPSEKRRHLMDPPSWGPGERDRVRIPGRPLLDPDERSFIPPPGPEVRPLLRGLIPGHRPRMHMDGPDHRGPMPRLPPPRGPPMPRGPPHMGERMRPPFGIVHGPEGFGKPGCVVAITNMAYQAGVEDILSFFKEFSLGKEDVIRRFNERGQPTGEARISFHTPQDAQKAVQELNRQPLAGRPVNLYLV
ncbi:uncharacterized protein LOC111624150 [Centruroides sculpturatus]|uniref:uncharacterized protein LOC111624150 n=1 Tax=Centruroides sculpturatus TaxID=218467 RepID=UPI000C6D2061|nr:uncharacterized protein LOC111624150 [Centruroides sculpturatus]XP_023222713.1 uncharacterized protein LOC111624150 [Centruroides sculpturatus]